MKLGMTKARNDVNKSRAKKKQKPFYWLIFLVAVIALSETFGGHKYISSGDTLKALIMIPTTMMIFLFCIFYLTYQVYAEEKERDNLKASFLPFDFIYEKWGTKKNG